MVGRLDIQLATPKDGAIISDLHVRSIEGLCSADYPSEVVHAWVTDKPAAYYNDAIASGREVIHLAHVDGEPVGFVSYKDDFLMALYLAPEAAGKGVGRALMELFEEEVRRAGHCLYRLTATMTALKFYERCGYHETERTVHRLDSGHEILCVRMEKPV